LALSATGTAAMTAVAWPVRRNHDVVGSGIKAREQERARSGIRYRRSHYAATYLRRNSDVASAQRLIDNAPDPVEFSGDDLDDGFEIETRLAGFAAFASFDDGFAGIEVEHQIDLLPGNHVELVNKLDT